MRIDYSSVNWIPATPQTQTKYFVFTKKGHLVKPILEIINSNKIKNSTKKPSKTIDFYV